MDLNQRKLNKEEWNGIEVPVNEREKIVLNLITKGFNDVNVKYNNNLFIHSFTRSLIPENSWYSIQLNPQLLRCILYINNH